MIAKNYMKHPEALRFQRELFSNGFHNSPRIMRLMECIFDWTPTVSDWWTAAKAKARALAKAVKKSIADLFKETKVIQLKFGFMGENMTLQHNPQPCNPADWPRLQKFSDWMDETFNRALTTTPNLSPYWGTGDHQWHMGCAGTYRRFCPTERHAFVVGGWSGHYSESAWQNQV